MDGNILGDMLAGGVAWICRFFGEGEAICIRELLISWEAVKRLWDWDCDCGFVLVA